MVDVVGYRREVPGSQPAHLFPAYASTVKRAPSQSLIKIPHTLTEVTGPLFGHDKIGPNDADLTKQCAGAPIGERMILSGRVLDEDSKPVPHTLVELCSATRPANTIILSTRMTRRSIPISPAPAAP